MSVTRQAMADFDAIAAAHSCSDTKCAAAHFGIGRVLVFADICVESLPAELVARIWARVDEIQAAAQDEVDAELSTKH